MSGMITKILRNYYKAISDPVIETIDATLEDIKKEQLTADKLVSRSAKLALDNANGFWGALLWSGAAPLPVVVCSMTQDQPETSGSVVIPMLDKPNLVSTQLFKVGGGDSIPKKPADVAHHIKLTVDTFALNVMIVGLTTPIPPGYYIASVINAADGNRVVAEITLTVV